VNYPILVLNLTNITSISAQNAGHALFMNGSGQVWSVGNNVNGQLGLGDTLTTRNVATLIPSLNNVRMISAGGLHSLFLFQNGSIVGCGDNSVRNMCVNL
jgi:alpha-tubulin suppressor-like RCC1 family protein